MGKKKKGWERIAAIIAALAIPDPMFKVYIDRATRDHIGHNTIPEDKFLIEAVKSYKPNSIYSAIVSKEKFIVLIRTDEIYIRKL